MAIAPLTLAESLRPWAAAGLAWLLADGPVLLAGADFPPANAPALAYTGKRAEPQALKRPGAGATAPQAPAVAASGGMSVADPGPAQVRKAGFPPHEDAFADPEQWPDPWRALFARTNPAALVWTYHELGQDICGQAGSADRGALLRTIIAELRLPKGSSAFWPTAMPDEDRNKQSALRSGAGLFAAGLRLIAPRLVIVSGKLALVDMGLDPSRFPVFTQQIIEGRLIVLVPDTAVLLQEPGQVLTTVTFLQAVLSSLALWPTTGADHVSTL